LRYIDLLHTVSTLIHLPLERSWNVVCDVHLLSLTFVCVVGVTAMTSELGLNILSVHTIVLPFQPGDDEASYAPKSPVIMSTQRLGSESCVIISVLLAGHGNHDIPFELDLVIIQ
jgi:hypothetical protein